MKPVIISAGKRNEEPLPAKVLGLTVLAITVVLIVITVHSMAVSWQRVSALNRSDPHAGSNPGGYPPISNSDGDYWERKKELDRLNRAIEEEKRQP